MSLPHRWSLDCNFLLGLTMREWWDLLRANDFAIDAAYAHRAAAISAMSTYNSTLGLLERLRLRDRLAEVQVQPPLIIIGHWRSGTTFLYQLLASDDRYCFPNAYQVSNPNHFLISEGVGSRVFGGLVPARRPPDNVALGFDLPEQDEYILALSSHCSPYVGHAFPAHAERYERYVSMREASPAERARFLAAHDTLVRKLTLLHDKPVILKSPAHTARIPLLLEQYPDARFLFIHRDPQVVFQSTRRLYDTLHWFWYLQKPAPETFDERILSRYVALHEAYFEDKASVPDGQLHEIAYADLVRDPIGTLARTYEALGLGSFEPFQPRLQARLDGLADYRTNDYAGLDEARRAQVVERWAPIYERWGYT